MIKESNIAKLKGKCLVISFGSNTSYVRLATRLLTKVAAIYPYFIYKVYKASDLDDSIRNYAKKYKRGFGYWQWKPYILNHAIEGLADGDILIYLDARSGMPNKPIPWLNSLLSDNSVDFCIWQQQVIEYTKTTGDLFSLLGISLESPIAKSGQFASTFFALRVNLLTRNIISSWLHIVTTYDFMCRDERSALKNHELFVENRYDQSVLSLLLKKSELRGAKIYRIGQKDIFGSLGVGQHNKNNLEAVSFYPWANAHPRSIHETLNSLRRFLGKIKFTIYRIIK